MVTCPVCFPAVVPGPVCSALVGSGSVCSALVGSGPVCSALVGSGSVCSALVGSGSVCSALGGSGPVCSALGGSGPVCSALGGSRSVCSALEGSRSVCSALVGSRSVRSALASSPAAFHSLATRTWTWPSFPSPVPPPLHHPPGFDNVWSVWKPLLGGGAMSRFQAMNFASLTTRGHSPITWTFTQLQITHRLHLPSFTAPTQLFTIITLTPENNLTSPSPNHTRYINPGLSLTPCRVLFSLATLQSVSLYS